MVDTSLAPCAFDAATGDLVLRVCGTSRHGQIVRLKSDKCSIGSGRQCTLRLRARGVRPLHCLLLRGAGGSVVRRWAPDTRLNGRAFTDADLAPGDRLSIAGIDLEVVALGQPEPQQPPTIQPPTTSLQQKLQSRRAELEAAKQQWQQEQSKAQQELQEQSEALGIRSAELDTRREALEQQRRQWEAERAEAESKSNRQAEQCGVAEAELQSRRAELEAAKQQWQQEQSKAQQELEEQSEALSIRSAELDTRREALEESQQEWDLERTKAQERLDQQTEQLAAERTELDRQREEFDRQRQQRQDEHTAGESQPVPRPDEPEPVEEASPGEASEESPVDLQSVLRRIGSVDLLQDDDDRHDRQRCEPQVEAQPETPFGAVSGETSALGSPAAEEEEDESIDDYMARLMDRVKTVADGSEPPDYRPRAGRPGTPGETEPAGDAPGREAADGRPEAPRLREPAEMSPRAVAPEKQAGLSAMRELANLSAKSAIDRHSRRKLLAVQRAKLAVTIAGAGVGGILIWLWWAKDAGPVTAYAALVAFLVAGFWGIQYAMATGRLIINRSGHLELNGKGKTAEQQEAHSKEEEAAD